VTAPRLCILGSGTALPNPTRGTSGYALFASDGTCLVLECGPGSTRRYPAAGVDVATVRGVLCTHHHVDHCGDLAALRFARNVLHPHPTAPLCLAGPVGHRRLLDGLSALYGPSVDDPRGTTEIRELRDGDRLDLGPFALRVREVAHVEGALGVRVEVGGRTFAFSGDSGPCEALVELCRGVDLALLECSYATARPSQGHLTTETAAQTATAAEVRHLVLTHFYPSALAVDREAEVRAAGYAGPLHLAEDLDVYHLEGAGVRQERAP
jgi:ribonuclease BN (tRNA processing enzyme)